MNQQNHLEKVVGAYETAKWGLKKIFCEQLINFGYWKDIKIAKQISDKQRMMASQSLYAITFETGRKFLSNKESKVLEVGCGFGGGILFLADLYPEIQFYGVEPTPSHYYAALKNLIHRENIQEIFNCSTEKFQPTIQFDLIFCVEVLQHITEPDCFLGSISSLLNENGIFCASAHLASSKAAQKKCQKLIPYCKDGIDILHPLETILSAAERNKINNLTTLSIGKEVFPKYKKWLLQQKIHLMDPDCMTIIEAWEQGLLDYYLIQGKKK